jgi:hypothetical protein
MNWTTQLGNAAQSFFNSFIVAGITVILSFNVGILNLGLSEWTLVANAAIAAGLMTIVKALNPSYGGYGIGSSGE